MVSALLGLGLNLDRQSELDFQRQLGAALLRAASPGALVYLETVIEQAPPSWDFSNELRTFHELQVTASPWVRRPELSFLGAWKGTEALGDQDLFLLGFMYDGEPSATTLQLMVDNNLAVLKDALELPIPPPILIRTWEERTAEVIFRAVDAQQASNEIARALRASDLNWVEPPWSDDFRAHRGPLRARLRLLRWARVLASTESFLTRAEGMALVATGCSMCAGMPASASMSATDVHHVQGPPSCRLRGRGRDLVSAFDHGSGGPLLHRIKLTVKT